MDLFKTVEQLALLDRVARDATEIIVSREVIVKNFILLTTFPSGWLQIKKLALPTKFSQFTSAFSGGGKRNAYDDYLLFLLLPLLMHTLNYCARACTRVQHCGNT